MGIEMARARENRQYLHCGECGTIMGEDVLFDGEKRLEFATVDRSWTCKKCGKYYLSSDGILKREMDDGIHYFYVW